MANLIDITSDAQFADLTAKKDSVTVLNFWAPWAEPCLQMNDVYAELATKFSSLTFLKVINKLPAIVKVDRKTNTNIQIEADNFADISEQFEIDAVPLFIILKVNQSGCKAGDKVADWRITVQNGKEVERVEGAKAAELANAVGKHAKSVSNAAAAGKPGLENNVKSAKDLNTRLKELINSAPVMLFIKGTPQQVRICAHTLTHTLSFT